MKQELLYAIALRARVLADYPKDVLRRACSENANSAHGARRETLGMSRGEMLEKILIDEFEREVRENED